MEGNYIASLFFIPLHPAYWFHDTLVYFAYLHVFNMLYPVKKLSPSYVVKCLKLFLVYSHLAGIVDEVFF